MNIIFLGKEISVDAQSFDWKDEQGNWYHAKSQEDIDVLGYRKNEISKKLPSKFQIGNRVLFGIQQKNIDEWLCNLSATIKGVHFYRNIVKYDLEIGIYDEAPTRIYNVDECFIQPYSEEAHRCYSVNK